MLRTLLITAFAACLFGAADSRALASAIDLPVVASPVDTASVAALGPTVAVAPAALPQAPRPAAASSPVPAAGSGDPVRDLLQQLDAAPPAAAHDPDVPRAPQGGASPASPPAPADAQSAPATGAPDAPSATPPASQSTTPATPAYPAARAAPAAPAAPSDLWARIRQGFKMPDLDTGLASNRTKWYAAQPDYITRMASRASMYLYYIVDEIERRGMPTELALLPFIESAMQPDATSRAKAVGLWQFIPSTGRLYALEQSPWKDDRRDVVESTRAALDYLQALYAQFNDWNLALAAYNCGEAGIDRALARNRNAKRPLDYASLRLPRETQYYVPKLQAIKNIIREPARYGIELPAIRNEPYFVAVNKARDIDVATAAKLADMPLEQFRALNPAFNRPVIVGASAPNILLPADRVDTFGANLAAWESTGQPLASWTTYRLRGGETLQTLAKRVGLSEAELREANRIPSRYRLGSGSTILIPRDESMEDDIDADSLAADFTLIPEPGAHRQVTYRVRRGDTLQTVARRWGVAANDIALWNGLHSGTLFAGQRLTLSVPQPAASKRKKSAPAARSATVATASGSGLNNGAAASVRSALPARH